MTYEEIKKFIKIKIKRTYTLEAVNCQYYFIEGYLTALTEQEIITPRKYKEFIDYARDCRFFRCQYINEKLS